MKKRIYDNVYGYIYLNEAEFELVTSPIFQRLQWIKQLGPLHVIFPSAQHSRFSHSLGVFHIICKMIEQLANDINGSDKKLLRFAALLHDIGHVPLSHIGEQVLIKTYPAKTDTEKIDISEGAPVWQELFHPYYSDSSKLHECFSAQIVLHNKEIDKILEKEFTKRNDRITAKGHIADLIVGKQIKGKEVLTTLLHSELDADRLDFLLRDSAFTGVGYGHVEFDYIISGMVIVTDKKGKPHLCIEDKGLHSVEHYILSRFFLQTQVIYNRKVRLLDLLFANVMEHMLTSPKDKPLLSLEDFLECIQGSELDNPQKERDRLHRIYKYTDAQVFTEMRKLHEELDPKIRGSKDSGKPFTKDEQKEDYINDCIKMIMDGKVSDPLETHQKLVQIKKNETESCVVEIEKEAKKIAENIAASLKIDENRIKIDLKAERIMKYSKLIEEAANRETVRTFYTDSDDEQKIICAAKSNASILRGLIDRKLLIFNVFYIKYRDINDTKNEKAIKKGFKSFVRKHFHQDAIAKVRPDENEIEVEIAKTNSTGI